MGHSEGEPPEFAPQLGWRCEAPCAPHRGVPALPGTHLCWLPCPVPGGVARAVPLQAPSSWGCWHPPHLGWGAGEATASSEQDSRSSGPSHATAGSPVPGHSELHPLCPEQAEELGAGCRRDKSSCQPHCKPCQPSCKTPGNPPGAKMVLQPKVEHPSALQPPCATNPPASPPHPWPGWSRRDHPGGGCLVVCRRQTFVRVQSSQKMLLRCLSMTSERELQVPRKAVGPGLLPQLRRDGHRDMGGFDGSWHCPPGPTPQTCWPDLALPPGSSAGRERPGRQRGHGAATARLGWDQCGLWG